VMLWSWVGIAMFIVPSWNGVNDEWKGNSLPPGLIRFVVHAVRLSY
jgi:hypothetical protein